MQSTIKQGSLWRRRLRDECLLMLRLIDFTLHQRNLEVAEISRINMELKQINAARDAENEDLREQILQVERKNK